MSSKDTTRNVAGAAPALGKTLRACERQVMKLKGVTGVALGEDAGRPRITVYIERPDKELQAKIPEQCDGVPVRIEVSGQFKAF